MPVQQTDVASANSPGRRLVQAYEGIRAILEPWPAYLRTTARTTADVFTDFPHTYRVYTDKLENGVIEADEWSDQYAATRAAKAVLYGSAVVAIFCGEFVCSCGWSGGK